jgi:hypothetical protein
MRPSHLLLTLCAGCLISCSGGGGSSGGSNPSSGSSASGTTVSGSVLAPGGQIALNPKSPAQFFANLLSSAAYAGISGSSAVPDGTVVQLGRLTGNGSGFSIISTTQTTGGRYSFNLTNLNLQFASDLIVRVISGAVQMRAFVVSDSIDLDPVSETAVRLALEQLASNPPSTLNNFTVQGKTKRGHSEFPAAWPSRAFFASLPHSSPLLPSDTRRPRWSKKVECPCFFA